MNIQGCPQQVILWGALYELLHAQLDMMNVVNRENVDAIKASIQKRNMYWKKSTICLSAYHTLQMMQKTQQIN